MTLRRTAALIALAVLTLVACDSAVPGDGGDIDGARAALSTAEAEVDGAARELAYDSGEWVVGVVVGSDQTDVTVSEDGSDVVRVGQPTALSTGEADEFGTVQVSVYEALQAASAEVSGSVGKAVVTTRGDAVAYEVALYPDSGGTTTVYVDAETGEVIS